MKTRFNLFRRAGVFYTEDTTTGKQTSLRTRDETEAKSLLNARNEAQRQPMLNLHLARAYLTASDPAFVERTWQTVMEQLQSRGKDSSRERYASVFKSSCFDALRHKKLLETTADDFFAVFKDGKVSIVYFLKRLHNFALSLGWIALPVVAPYLWPKYEAKERRGITPDEQQSMLAIEKKAEWKLFLELLWETGAAQGDAAAMTAEDVDWQKPDDYLLPRENRLAGAVHDQQGTGNRLEPSAHNRRVVSQTLDIHGQRPGQPVGHRPPL